MSGDDELDFRDETPPRTISSVPRHRRGRGGSGSGSFSKNQQQRQPPRRRNGTALLHPNHNHSSPSSSGSPSSAQTSSVGGSASRSSSGGSSTPSSTQRQSAALSSSSSSSTTTTTATECGLLSQGSGSIATTDSTARQQLGSDAATAAAATTSSPTKRNATAGRTTKRQRLRARTKQLEEEKMGDAAAAAAAAAPRSDVSSSTLQTGPSATRSAAAPAGRAAGLQTKERKEVRFSQDETFNSKTATTKDNGRFVMPPPGRFHKDQRVRWSRESFIKSDDVDELDFAFAPESSVVETTKFKSSSTLKNAAAAKPGRAQKQRTQFESVANSDRASKQSGEAPTKSVNGMAVLQGNDNIRAATKPASTTSPTASTLSSKAATASVATAASSKVSSPLRLNKRPLRTKNQRLRAKQLEEQARAVKKAAEDASSTCSSGKRRATGLPPRPPSDALKKKKAKSHPLASVPEHASLPTSKRAAATVRRTSTATRTSSSNRGSAAAQRVDIYTEQEAGNYQVLRDECLFLCSIITSCTSSSASSPLSAAVELLSLLSDRKKRRALFAGHDDGEPLQALLSVFAWVQTAVAVGDEEKSEVGSSLLRASQTSRQDDDGCAASTQESPGNFSLTSMSSSNDIIPKFAAADRQPLLDTIGMCLYFVSLDCTLSDYGAFSAAVASARRIRRAILSHAESLQGMLTLILVDPLTRRLRGTMPVMGAVQIDNLAGVLASPVASVQFQAKNSTTMSVASTPTKDSPSSSKGTSLDTPDSKASSRSADPTLAGRRRGKKRRLEQKSSKLQDDGLSFGSETPVKKKFSQADVEDGHSTASSIERKDNKTNCRLDQITLRILDCVNKTTGKSSGVTLHNCSQTDHDASLISTSLPLIALSQIISGKAKEDERSCIDDDHGLEAEKGKEEDHNPIFETNRLLGENGVIPLLSQAVADTMVAVTQVLEQSNKSTIETDGRNCPGCLVELEHRVSKLVSLVDGASLLSDSNRRRLCEEGYSSETGGYLIVSLVAVLSKLLEISGGSDMLFKGTWGEILLLTLRTLTSLSHDNDIAASELETSFKVGTGAFAGSGLDVVARVLHSAVKNRNASGTDSKLMYDSTIFCLNILANAVESGASCGSVSRIELSAYDGESKLCFLTWLTRWLVEETRTFRDAVTESTFGASPSQHTDRKLEAHEDEKLVTAGNGFVLLTCLLVDEKKSGSVAANGFSTTAHERIMEELPGDGPDAKMAYLKNTLKAFCNFYHYSLGGLSVAVVAPVKILIKRLDALQEKKPSAKEELEEEEKKEEFAAQSS